VASGADVSASQVVAPPVAAHRTPHRPARQYLYLGIPLVLALVAGLAAVVLYSGRHHTATSMAPPPASQVSSAQSPDLGAAPAPLDGASASASPMPSPSTVDKEASALAELNRLRAEDLPTVRFDGRYVAQLASKSVGISDPYQIAANGTHTFYASDILAEHEALRNGDNPGARVVLVLSTDYGHRQLYRGQPLWVTFALGSFDSPDAVASWCRSRFPQLTGYVLTNQCTARTLVPLQ
jgi:hypothetical protein